MSSHPEKAGEVGTKEAVFYRETIPFGKVYHGVMGALMCLLAPGLVVFWLAELYAGVIALGVTVPFVGWAYVGCRKTEMVVTHECFGVRYWFAELTVPLKNILSVRVRDKIVLPPSYQGHIKVGYGWHSWRDLKVMVCRTGLPVLEMNTRDGVTVIVTPLHADRLAQVLGQRIGSNSKGTEKGVPADAGNPRC
jgi:hypothetical protein